MITITDNRADACLVVIRFYSKFRFYGYPKYVCLHSYYELFLFHKIHKMLQNQVHQTSGYISYKNQIPCQNYRAVLTMRHAKELSNFPHHNNTRTTKISLLLVPMLDEYLHRPSHPLFQGVHLVYRPSKNPSSLVHLKAHQILDLLLKSSKFSFTKKKIVCVTE